MPTIVFIGNALGREKRIEAPNGGDLVDICDDVFAPIPFSCRSASCATCQVVVIEGGEHLEMPNEHEAELLKLLNGPATTRLACQARVRAGPGLVRLRPIGA